MVPSQDKCMLMFWIGCFLFKTIYADYLDKPTTDFIAKVHGGDAEKDAQHYKEECKAGLMILCQDHEEQCKHLEGYSKVLVNYAHEVKTENPFAKLFLNFKDNTYKINHEKDQFKHLNKEELLTTYFNDYIYGKNTPDNELLALRESDAQSYVAEMYCQHRMCQYDLTTLIHKKCHKYNNNSQNYFKCVFLGITMSEAEKTPMAKYYFTYLFMAIVWPPGLTISQFLWCDRNTSDLDTNDKCLNEFKEDKLTGKNMEEDVKNIYFSWSLETKGEFMGNFMRDIAQYFTIAIERLKYGLTIDDFCEKVKLT